MAIGADITRTFSPLAHSLPQPPSTRFFPERIKKNPQQTNNKYHKTTVLSQCSPSLLPSTERGNLGWMTMPLCAQATGYNFGFPILWLPTACWWREVAGSQTFHAGCLSPAVPVGVPLPMCLCSCLVCRHLFPTAMGAFGELDLQQLKGQLPKVESLLFFENWDNQSRWKLRPDSLHEFRRSHLFLG